LLVYCGGRGEGPEIKKKKIEKWQETIWAGLLAKLRAALLVLHST